MMKHIVAVVCFSILFIATECRAEKRVEEVKPFWIVAIHDEQTGRDVVQIIQDGWVKLTHYATYRGNPSCSKHSWDHSATMPSTLAMFRCLIASSRILYFEDIARRVSHQ